MPNSETEKYFRAKRRDQRFARWFTLIVFGIPLALMVGGCLGAAIG